MFNLLNKHFYILLIISTLSKYTNTKFYKFISWIVKIFVFANIILGVGYIIYFSYLDSSFSNGLSNYYDLIINFWNDSIKFWNDVINISIEDSIASKVKDSNISNQIQESVKEGIKSGVKELLDELQENDMQSQANSDLLKQLALFSSVLFFGYFLFILPGSSMTPEALTEYNWFNQSLIEFKISFKDFIVNLFSNPSNPGTPSNKGVVLPNSPTSPTLSVSTEALSTVTPNTPIASNSNLTPYFKNSIATQTSVETVNSSTETHINGIAVSKMVETTNIVADVLGKENSNTILNHVNSTIKILLIKVIIPN